MKSTKMKFAKKLKSIKASEYLNQDRFLQMLTATDAISEYLPKITNPISQITAGSMWRSPQKLEDQIEIEKKEEAEEAFGNEENVPPPVNQIPRVSCDRKDKVSCESDTGNGRKSFGFGFRRPDLNSNTLFDPKLLEAFELAVKCFRRIDDFSIESRFHDEDNVIVLPNVENDENPLPPVTLNLENDENALPPVIAVAEDRGKGENVTRNYEEGFQKDDNTLRIVEEGVEEVGLEKRLLNGEEESGNDGDTLIDPLSEFEERCPPGGEESVVFYTTSLRGIRKTFDDCNMIRFLLDSFKVKYYERDVSMHRQYREELRRVSLTETDVLPPVLFVKGRRVGGAQRVLCLHEQGKLKVLFDGVEIAGEERCVKCDGFRFVMCEGCRGSRRIVSGDGTRIQCLLCNENGLIVCGDCS